VASPNDTVQIVGMQQRAAVRREIKLRLGDGWSDRVNLRDFLADVVLRGGV
jgi:hypothetical protein